MNQLNDSQADIRADLNFGLFLTKNNHVALSKKVLKNALYQPLLGCFYDALKLIINCIERGEYKNRNIIND